MGVRNKHPFFHGLGHVPKNIIPSGGATGVRRRPRQLNIAAKRTGARYERVEGRARSKCPKRCIEPKNTQ